MLRSPGTRHTPKARRIWERLGGTSTSSSADYQGVAHLRYALRTRGGCSYQATIPEGETVSGSAACLGTPERDEHQLVRGVPGCSACTTPFAPGADAPTMCGPASSSSGCPTFPGGGPTPRNAARVGTPGRDEHQLVRARPGVRCYCRRVIRQLRCIRGLRWKSLSRVWAEISSTWYFSSSAGSSLKRRKLLEKYSTPPGARRAMAMSSSCTWSRCTSNTSSMRLELEKVGGSMKIRSYSPLSCSSHS